MTRTRLQPATELRIAPLPPRRLATTRTSGEQAGRKPAQGREPMRPLASSTAPSATRALSFTTPVSVRGATRVALRDSETTLAELVLSAVAAHIDDLPALIAAERPASAPALGPFPDAPGPARARTDAEPRVNVSLRLSAGNLQVLDQLVEESGADSRSQLITAALRRHLNL